MSSSGPHVTITGGTFTMSGLQISSNGTLIMPGPLKATKLSVPVTPLKLFSDHKYPDLCLKRRGGPKSKIHCEVFKHVEHVTHCGRSSTGRWYSWEES